MEIGLSLSLTSNKGVGLPYLPPGFVFLVDDDGAFLVDSDGAFLITEA